MTDPTREGVAANTSDTFKKGGPWDPGARPARLCEKHGVLVREGECPDCEADVFFDAGVTVQIASAVLHEPCAAAQVQPIRVCANVL